jgi:hypothetical protein
MSSVVRGGLANVQAVFTQTPASGAFAGATVALPPVRFQASFQNGTASDQIDGLSYQNLTFVSGTPQTINLLTLLDGFGNALTVAHITFLALKVTGADGSSVAIGDAATTPWTPLLGATGTLTIYAGSANAVNDGFTVIAAPGATCYPVVTGNNNLEINPSANVTVTLIIGTRSV